LRRLNRLINASVDPGKFITVFLGLIDQDTGEMRYANAGHDAPLLVSADGTVEELGGGGLILGAFPDTSYEEGRTQLDPMMLLSVFTDGVTEAQNPSGEFFDRKRLIEVLKAGRGVACEEAMHRVVRAVQDFTQGSEQSDDITLVMVKRR
jgi:sigma-B regulation protein RsbU (phosphoserine phosphatase)